MLGDELAAEVRRHDDDDVLEVDRAALAVRQPAVVEQLQQHVEHLRMRLLDLVEQHDRVRPPADGLGELAGLVVADVSGRRADHPRHGVLLLVLRHVDPDHRVLVVEQELGERARQLGLADAGRAEKDEAAERPIRILQAGARAANRVGDRRDRLVLADRRARGGAPPCESASGFRLPSAGSPGCWSTWRRLRRCLPRRLPASACVTPGRLGGAVLVLQRLLELRNAPVLQLRRLGVVAGADSGLQLEPRLLRAAPSGCCCR